MIATHNIKVNGKWIRPGESYEPATVQEQILVEPEPAEKENESAEAPKPAAKPRSSTRRKVSK